jgi:hypothetical protein
MADMVHAMVTWSPRSKFDPDAPRGLALWAEILETNQGDQCYCWWGKVSDSGNVGMTQKDVELLNRQIQHEERAGHRETHLYMFCPDPILGSPSLHVGLVVEVRGEDNGLKTDPHSPNFFERVTRPVPFWFKMTDIRIIPPKRLNDLLIFSQGRAYDPNTTHAMPLLLKEHPQKTFFAEKILEKSGWKQGWEQILYEGPAMLRPVHKKISIEEGRIYNYRNLFGDYLKSAREIRIWDPYIRKPYQIQNIVDLLGLVREPRKTRATLETMYEERMEDASRRLLNELKAELLGKGFDFNWKFDPSFHDRLIETEKWEIYLGRGLDFISNGKTKRCNIFFVQK